MTTIDTGGLRALTHADEAAGRDTRLAPGALLALLDRLDAAEARVSEEKTLRMKATAAATRAEARADIRGRAVAIYRQRAREAETRIKALRDGSPTRECGRGPCCLGHGHDGDCRM